MGINGRLFQVLAVLVIIATAVLFVFGERKRVSRLENRLQAVCDTDCGTIGVVEQHSRVRVLSAYGDDLGTTETVYFYFCQCPDGTTHNLGTY